MDNAPPNVGPAPTGLTRYDTVVENPRLGAPGATAVRARASLSTAMLGIELTDDDRVRIVLG